MYKRVCYGLRWCVTIDKSNFIHITQAHIASNIDENFTRYICVIMNFRLILGYVQDERKRIRN